MATFNGMSTKVDEGGVKERRVQTVDHHQSPGSGQGQMQRTREIEVIHQHHPSREGGGVVAGAAAAMANTIQSVKDALTGTNSSEERKDE